MNQGPYHLISIGLLFILIYVLSLLTLRMQLITKVIHRKVWNSLLLLFFLFTAVLGLILAVKVNYKLNIPWIEEAMQWHVDLGIGFALVALFHLSWHLGYYRRLQANTKELDKKAEWTPHLSISAAQGKRFFLLLGYISIMAQLILLREFLKNLHGNELVIGVFLALWMIITAIGAWAGAGYRARLSLRTLLKLVLIMGASPLLIYLLLILINRIIFLPGYEPGLMASIVHIVLLTGPFTLISGFLFSYVSRSLTQGKSDSDYYMLDSLGSLLGGLLLGIILVLIFDNIQLISFLFLTTALAVMLVYGFPYSVFQKLLLLLTSTLLFTLFLFPGVRNSLEGLRYKNELILETKDTPFGNLTYTTNEGQVTGYMDRNPVFSSADLARAEEKVHFPALQHPNPSSFLLLEGGFSGIVSEVSKYHPGVIDYCVADPWVFDLSQKHIPEVLPEQFRFISMDGRNWLIKADSIKYDVVISLAGDPYTLGWNRFFTMEFFQLVKDHLSIDGVFCMELSTAGNYINEAGGDMLSINYHTLKKVFQNVLIVPGQATYFLASAQELSLDFPALLERSGILTTYVHPDYMDVSRISFDSDQLMERLDNESKVINKDLWPRLFFASLTSLESRMGTHSMKVTGILSVLVFLLLLIFYPPLKAGMYISGFTGAGIQITLIMVMQSLYGYAYMVAPVMITIFMAGIVMGTLVWKFCWRSPSRAKITGLLMIMALLAALIVLLLKNEHLFIRQLTGQMVLGLLNFIPGLIVGSVYGMSVAIAGKKDGSRLGRFYSADLAGASLGTLIPVIFLLPLIGVTNTFILFCGINVATGLYILTRRP